MKNVTLNSIKKLKDFILIEEPIEFKGFRAIGYFPYEKARLNSQECIGVPRNVFSEIETILARTRHFDNKVVYVFKDLVNFDTHDFAIQFKDAYAKIGSLEQIIGYNGQELKKLEVKQDFKVLNDCGNIIGYIVNPISKIEVEKVASKIEDYSSILECDSLNISKMFTNCYMDVKTINQFK